MSSKTKKILATIAVLAMVGLVSVYYMWNKEPRSARNAEGVKTEAAALHQLYTTDSASAKQTFTEQVAEVSGIVAKLSKNQQGQDLVMLKTGTDGAYINCTMEEAIAGLKEGEPLKIKGICHGIGQGDADLGIPGDVYLGGCYLMK